MISRRHMEGRESLLGYNAPDAYIVGNPWQGHRPAWRGGKGLGGSGIYGVLSEDVGMIKIGRTSDLMKRYLGLETACPVKLRLIAWVRGPRTLERELHEALSAERVHLEWFRDRPAVRRALWARVQEFGGGYVDEGREGFAGVVGDCRRAGADGAIGEAVCEPAGGSAACLSAPRVHRCGGVSPERLARSAAKGVRGKVERGAF